MMYMTIFEKFQSMTIDKFAEWLDENIMLDESPWLKWWDKNYCSQCEPVLEYNSFFDRECECAWCEINKKCRYFQDMNDYPSTKEVIKMWLESDDDSIEDEIIEREYYECDRNVCYSQEYNGGCATCPCNPESDDNVARRLMSKKE